jgi:ATP-dependent Clp protease ATP-binding subunit ClpA
LTKEKGMFEEFSVAARQAVVVARSEAMRAGQPTIGCEHLLLALLSEPHGAAGQALTAAGLDLADLRTQVAAGTMGTRSDGDSETLDAEALASLGIDLDTVRRAADAAFGRGALDRAAPGRPAVRALGRRRMTAGAKKSLQLALHSAVALRQRQITTGHLLIGIIDQKDNAALRLLAEAGADAGALRADVLARIASAA